MERYPLKKCKGCGEVKPTTEFHTHKVKGKVYPATYCKPCNVERNRQWRKKNPLKRSYHHKKSHAKERGIAFTLTFEEFSELWTGNCAISGVKLSGIGNKVDSGQLDRINPQLGYVTGNVHFISFRLNRIKSDATLDELKSIVKYLEEVLK